MFQYKGQPVLEGIKASYSWSTTAYNKEPHGLWTPKYTIKEEAVQNIFMEYLACCIMKQNQVMERTKSEAHIVQLL